MKKIFRIAVLGTTTVVIAAGALAAQATDSTRGSRAQREARRPDSLRPERRKDAVRARGPEEILFRGIELTPQQRSALESARVKSILDQKPIHSELVAARSDLEVARIRRDSTAAKSATERMTNLRERFAAARETREKDMRAVLTPDQLSQLDRNIGYAQSRRDFAGRFAGRAGREGRRGAMRDRARGFDDRDRARGTRGRMEPYRGGRGMMPGNRRGEWGGPDGLRGFGPSRGFRNMWRDRGDSSDAPSRRMWRDRNDASGRFPGRPPAIRQPGDSTRS